MPNQAAIARLGRFLTVGGCAAVVDFSSLWILHHWMVPTLAFTGAYLAGITTHFLLNKYWTFRCARTDWVKQVAEYLAVTAITYLVQLVGFRVGLATFRQNVFLAKAVAIPPGTLVGFYLLKMRVFKEAAELEGQSG